MKVCRLNLQHYSVLAAPEVWKVEALHYVRRVSLLKAEKITYSDLVGPTA